MTIPKEYIPHEVEPKWKEAWNMSMYHFDWEDYKRPQFIIDTPPPYPTGNFHKGTPSTGVTLTLLHVTSVCADTM